MPNQTSSPNSKAPSSSRLYESSLLSMLYRSSSSKLRTSSSSRSHETSSPNTKASSSSMHNQASSSNASASSPSIPYQSISRVSPSSIPNQTPLPNQTLQDLLNMSSSASSSSPQLSPAAGATRRPIVGIRVLNSNAILNPRKFFTGDIVKTVTGADNVSFSANFPNGKFSLLGELFNFHNSGVNTLTIKVRRSEHEFTRRALIVPRREPPFVLVDSDDVNHEFIFEDYTEDTCLALQVQGHERMLEELSHVRVAACNVPCPWVENTEQPQNAEVVSMLYSMLVVPHAYGDVNTPQFSSLEETVHQAKTWLYASKRSGVPLLFHNIQTEPLLTEDFEQNVSAYPPSIISTGSYGSRQSADGCVIKAVRIWFAFQFGEVKLELMARQGEDLLGVTIGRTIEGFCYVTKVNANSAADRAGLKGRLEAAEALGMKLVVTKVGSERVMPLFILNGIIRCSDNSSISNILSEHRRAGKPAYLHVINLEGTACPTVLEETNI